MNLPFIKGKKKICAHSTRPYARVSESLILPCQVCLMTWQREHNPWGRPSQNCYSLLLQQILLYRNTFPLTLNFCIRTHETKEQSQELNESNTLQEKFLNVVAFPMKVKFFMMTIFTHFSPGKSISYKTHWLSGWT